MSDIKQFGASFTFDDITTSDYYVWVSGVHTFDAPVREMETITVPGRSGDLLIDGKRFSNVEITYPCFISKSFPNRFDSFRAAMMSKAGKYYQLSDTYHPNEIRLATIRGPIAPQTGINNQSGLFDIVFNCMPQRWLRSGLLPQSFTAGGAITNPTLYPSQPYLRVVGHGQLIIGGKIMTVAENPFPYIDIDCQAMDAHYGATNANSYITLNDGDFPTLSPGESTFTIQSSITRLEITPRWWTV